MNWSAGLVALVPAAVVTVTSTVPVPGRGGGGDGGRVVDGEASPVRGPKFTAVAPVKFVPVTVTEVPPVLGPEVGLDAGDGGRGRRRRVGVLVGGVWWRSCRRRW